MSTSRFFKRGPLDVVRGLLDVREALPTEMIREVQLSAEIRALRVFEEFAEGIIRWAIIGNQGAVAAQNSGLMICLNGAGNNFPPASGVAVPPGTIFTIDEVKNFSAGAVRLMIGASTGGLISAVPADYTDARWGPSTGVPPIRAVQGTQGGISGQEIDGVASNERLQRDGIFIGIAEQVAEPLGGNQTLTLFNVAVNQAQDIRVQGRIILPR